MIRMICINNKTINNIPNKDLVYLKEGETYEGFIVEKEFFRDGIVRDAFYISPLIGFAIERFIPCSDIDETELINEKELVNN